MQTDFNYYNHHSLNKYFNPVSVLGGANVTALYSTPFGPHYSSILLCLARIVLSSGLSDPGHHLLAGEHLGHHSYCKEQEPALTHVLLHLQVNSSHNIRYNGKRPLWSPGLQDQFKSNSYLYYYIAVSYYWVTLTLLLFLYCIKGLYDKVGQKGGLYVCTLVVKVCQGDDSWKSFFLCIYIEVH